MQVSGEESSITGINVTPLVDILLVILIIFMATAPMIARQVLKVDVPRAAHHERIATESLRLVYNVKREILLGNRKLTTDQLSAELAARSKAEEGLRLTLSADKNLPYGDIVGLLDVVRGAGVRKIALEVRRP